MSGYIEGVERGQAVSVGGKGTRGPKAAAGQRGAMLGCSTPNQTFAASAIPCGWQTNSNPPSLQWAYTMVEKTGWSHTR